MMQEQTDMVQPLILETPGKAGTYQAYLLRLWRGGSDKPWRSSLIPLGSEDEELHFPDVETMVDFLRDQTTGVCES